jgi:hypothetical protein
LRRQQLRIRRFLQERLNAQKPKGCSSTSWPRPGLTPNDFFFGYLKEKLHGISFTTSDDLPFAIWHIFSEIPEMVLKNVLTNWIARLSCVREKRGESYSK